MEAKKTKKQQQHSFIPPVLLTNTNQFLPGSTGNNFTTRSSLINSNLNSIVIGEQPNNCFVCFNPYCTLPYSRIFVSNHTHKNVQACERWIVAVSDLGKMLHTPKDKRNQRLQFNCIEFDVMKNCIGQTIKSWKLAQKVDWTKYLLNFKNMFMTKIQQEFNNILLNTKNKIQMLKCQQIIQNLTQLYNNIHNKQKNQVQLRKFIQYLIQQYIGPMINKTITIKCPQMKDIELPSLSPITSSLIQKIILQKEQGMKLSVVSEQNHQQFQQFLLNDSAPFNKLQQVASMCGKKSDQYTIKSRGISLKCPFCNHVQKQKLSVSNFQQQMKMIKKNLAVQLLTHCFNCHYSFIYSKYQLKKSKRPAQSNHRMNNSQPRQISFQQLISELQSNNYTKLHIFDRESGIPNPTLAIKSQPNTFKLEILSKNNRPMAKMNFILTPDRKCTQFMINYVSVYVCLVQRLLDIDDICIQSNCKDINRIQNLQFMLLGSSDAGLLRNRQRNQSYSRQNQPNTMKRQIDINRQNQQIQDNEQLNLNFFDLNLRILNQDINQQSNDKLYESDSQQQQQISHKESPVPKIQQAVLQQVPEDPRKLLKKQKQLQNKNEQNKQMELKVKIQQ